ncbi:MAG: helix-turn-helix transcriptional regulator [Bacteroidia bacterium]
MERSRLSRLAAILTFLQSKKLITATEIAKRFEVSVRTVYRDIRALEASGVPIYTEEGKGYSLVEGYRIPPVMFTEDEANALITAESLIIRNKDTSLVKHYVEAITKIKAVLGYEEKEKADLLSQRLVFMQNLKLDSTSDYLLSIQSAIINFQRIELKYLSLYKDELTERSVQPLALYSTQENWILIAYCELREAQREFRLDQIQELQLSEDLFEPHDFSLIEYFLGPQ